MTIDRTKIFTLILIAVFAFLQYRLWFEPGGVRDMLQVKKELSLQLQKNDIQKKRNEKLIAQVRYLQASTEAVESRARGELGMIKKDETFYQVVK